MEETKSISLRDTDPAGRFDVMAFRLAEHFTKTVLEPKLNNLPIWKHGVGDVIEEAIRKNLPARVFTPVDIARELGILPREVKPRTNRGRK